MLYCQIMRAEGEPLCVTLLGGSSGMLTEVLELFNVESEANLGIASWLTSYSYS